jgi:hypothetical protein
LAFNWASGVDTSTAFGSDSSCFTVSDKRAAKEAVSRADWQASKSAAKRSRNSSKRRREGLLHEPVSYCCPYDATHVDDRVWIVEGSSGLSFIAFTHVLT